MAASFSTQLRNNLLNLAANGGMGFAETFKNGIIEIYSGTRPTNADSATTGSTLLGTLTLNGGAFTPGVTTNGLNWGTAASGAIDKPSSAVWQMTGIAAGTASWARIKGNATDAGAASTVLPRIDLTIAQFGGDITLSDTNITVGKVITCSKANFIAPGL